MRYRFTVNAQLDLFDAGEFYDSQRAGLGTEFGVALGLALSKVMESPDSWPEIEPGYRRYRLSRFPYALIYHVMPRGVVEIVAVFDLRAQPGSWRRNLS